MLDILAKQVASPVQFVKGLHTLHDAGARVFVEVGPKKALQGFVDDVLGEHSDVVSLFTNHPKFGDVVAFNQALVRPLCGGIGPGSRRDPRESVAQRPRLPPRRKSRNQFHRQRPRQAPQLRRRLRKTPIAMPSSATCLPTLSSEAGRFGTARRRPTTLPVVITGAALGLPGTEHIFDDANIGRILRGDQFINPIPARLRHAMLDKHITRLVKSDNGGPTFETINNVADVIKLAGRGGAFDLEEEFGVSAERVAALDRVTRLAIAVGIDALRDAGIPLVMRYKTTSKGTQLPDRWGLPDALRDDTGVIFASAFPGYDSFADEMSRYYADHARREQLATLESLLARAGRIEWSF